ncbi:MAG: UPF0175 family protein [Saprospiraceae bacterium]
MTKLLLEIQNPADLEVLLPLLERLGVRYTHKEDNEPGESANLERAIQLYQEGILSSGKASKVARISRIAFQKELGKRQIPVNYDEEDLEKDLATLGIK